MIFWIFVFKCIEYFVFIIILLKIIFNAFHLIDCEREASSIAHFSLMYLYSLPAGGRMKNQNMPKKIIIINEGVFLESCVCLDWYVNEW